MVPSSMIRVLLTDFMYILLDFGFEFGLKPTIHQQLQLSWIMLKGILYNLVKSIAFEDFTDLSILFLIHFELD